MSGLIISLINEMTTQSPFFHGCVFLVSSPVAFVKDGGELHPLFSVVYFTAMKEIHASLALAALYHYGVHLHVAGIVLKKELHV